MKYWKITIDVERNMLESLTGRLLNAGFDAFEVVDPMDLDDVLHKDHDYDYDVADESLMKTDRSRNPQVILYLEESAVGGTQPVYLRAVEDAVFALEGVSFEKELVDDSLWKNSYKEHFSITRMADSLVVVPSWEIDRYEREKETTYAGMKPVYMDPGSAFGTGDHPTTSMCASLMEEAGCSGKAVLDVGTGSGILAIGAAALGAAPVLGVEIDPEAVRIAVENVEKNNCQDVVEIREGDLLAGVDFEADIVVANLFAEIIVRLIPAIRTHLKKDGVFISTGILKERFALVEACLHQHGFAVRQIRETDEWCAVEAVVK